jgi:branched-chain amino acid transport system ATP-binding protein
MLRLKNINSYYGQVHVLKNVSMHINEGEILTLIGANGAGKTTTLNSINGLIPPREGKIFFRDNEVTGTKPDRLVEKGIAQVPEGRQIFRPMTVFENLELGGYLIYKSHGRRQLTADIEKMYDMFPILKEREGQYAGTLSGGEQQMLAIAMALMCRPKLLLMDEPSMGLAPLIIREIFNTIVKLKEAGVTVLLVEQNAKAALKIADRGYVMETGKIILEEKASELLENREVQRAYLGREKQEDWE